MSWKNFKNEIIKLYRNTHVPITKDNCKLNILIVRNSENIKYIKQYDKE